MYGYLVTEQSPGIKIRKNILYFMMNSSLLFIFLIVPLMLNYENHIDNMLIIKNISFSFSCLFSVFIFKILSYG
jgi:hypothetical protein